MFSAESFVVNFTLFIKTNLKTLSPEGYFATFEFPDKTGNESYKISQHSRSKAADN
jgi:hypothetical protein